MTQATMTVSSSSWARSPSAQVGLLRVSSRVGTAMPPALISMRRSSRGRNSCIVRAIVTGGKSVQPSQVSMNGGSPKTAAPASTNDESSKSASQNGGGVATETTVGITVVGASGDLAKKRIFPALFALYYEGCLPKN